jgi:NADH:ubiquinone oxidoreductase subunit E
MSFVPFQPILRARLNELLTHYPGKAQRLAHVAARHSGTLRLHLAGSDGMDREAGWSLQPINIYELVTFYPMFRQEKPAGKYRSKFAGP